MSPSAYSCVILVCSLVTIEMTPCANQLIGSSTREEEMLAYVSYQVGQKWSMSARYAGLDENEIQEIIWSAQDHSHTTMKKI